MTLPSRTSRSVASQISSHGVVRSMWWNWYRSMWSVPSRRRESSAALADVEGGQATGVGALAERDV